jgi:CarD family transcriptional regulator
VAGVEGPGLGRPAAAVEEAHLAEHVAPLHEGDHRLPAGLARPLHDGDATGHDHVHGRRCLVLFEQHVVAGQSHGPGGGRHRGETTGAEHREQRGGGQELGRHSGEWYAPVHPATSSCPLCAHPGTLGPSLLRPTRRGMPETAFDVGDKVVYPHHGAAVIEKREQKEVFGEKREYLVLKLAYGDLTLMVPCDNTDEVGLREVINDEEVEEVFAVLRKKEARMPTNWSRRYKNHVEKLKSGDIYQVAEVVRNLSIRDKDKGLSAGEKRMLTRARQILVSELTFAIGVTEEEAEQKLNEALP